MRLMTRRSCSRALILLLTASSLITFAFLLRCNGGSRPDDNGEAELLLAARGDAAQVGNVAGVGAIAVDLTEDSRPEDSSSRRRIAGHNPQEPAQQRAKLEPYLKFNNEQQSPLHQYKEIECIINDEYTVQGRLEGSEVYMPFSFIHKYFEIQGRVVQYDGQERFEWHHSNAKVYTQEPYRSDGLFMSFHHYSVENRDRVKYFSGVEGVPLSTQWGQQGYFYPIQIAQFGLSHYSKNLTDRAPRVTMYENAETGDLSAWSSPDLKSELKVVTDDALGSRVVEFKTSGVHSLTSNSAWSRSIDTKSDFVLAFNLKFFANSSITILAESEEQGRYVSLHYAMEDDGFRINDKHITYGLGPVSQWRTITRNLQIDYKKAMTSLYEKKSKTKRKFVLQRLIKIELRGHGRIDNIKLATTLHMYHFFDAADWLVNHQDERGGWPIMVERLLDDKMTLPPGWYSSMAQGQAMSTLVRAYIKTRSKRYVRAALRAIRPYEIPATEGGVLTKFMDKFVWYEEYPTTPGSFVLNGFIYSLIGLYDLLTVVEVEESREARRLYTEGIASLKAMLPLFDVGSGTIYDLRHIALGTAPNLARWDYHAAHISQLQLLASIDPDPIFKDTVARWIGYTKGKRAKHN